MPRAQRQRFQSGVCFGCGCTDDYGCDAGCTWADHLHTMCSACVERAQRFLAWSKTMGATAISRRRQREARA
jgi:hypothetical protein